MVMVKKVLFSLCITLFFTACASEITRLKQTEYLRTHPGKPVVYPGDVDQPMQEKSYAIPELPKSSAQASSEPPELLALPPRLAGVDISKDEEDEEENEEGQQVEDEPEELEPAEPVYEVESPREETE